MAGRKRNLSATFEDDGYEYVDKKILVRQIETKAGIRYQVDFGKSSGKYIRKTFETRKEARAAAKDQINALENYGLKATLLTEPEKKDAAKALAILKSFSASLESAAKFYENHHRETTDDTLVSSLIDRYVSEKRDAFNRGILRLRSYRGVTTRTGLIRRAVGSRNIDSITHDDIMDMLSAYHGKNRENYRRAARTFFKWAKNSGFMTIENPVTDRTKFECIANPILFYHPTDVQAVMFKVVELHPIMTAYWSLAFFAGIRSAELMLLDWQDVRLSGTNPVVTIKGAIAKKKYLRRVKLEPNCVAWLATVKDRAGPIAPFSDSSLERWRKAVFSASGVELLPNGARHSYASYHLQSRNHLGELLQNMGHKNSIVLLNHYADVTDKETADAYFQIRPSAGVVQFSKAL